MMIKKTFHSPISSTTPMLEQEQSQEPENIIKIKMFTILISNKNLMSASFNSHKLKRTF